MDEKQQAFDPCPSPGRSLPEIILKTLSIRIAVTMVVGHLGTLRQQPLQVHEFHTLGFIALPFLPVATLCENIGRVVSRAWGRHYSTPYLISAALGVRCVSFEHAEGTEDFRSWHLLDVNEADIRREESKRDLRWFGRMLALLVFLAQAIASVDVCIGRLSHGMQYVGVFDAFNALYLIGGIVAGVQCLFIHLCGWTWRWRRDREPRIAHWQTYLASTEPSRHDFFYNRTRPLTLGSRFEITASSILALVCFFPGRVTTLLLLFSEKSQVTAVSYNSHHMLRMATVLNLIVFMCLYIICSILWWVDTMMMLSDWRDQTTVSNFRLRDYVSNRYPRMVRGLGSIKAVSVPCIFVFSCYILVVELLDVGLCLDDEKLRCQWLSWEYPKSDNLWQF